MYQHILLNIQDDIAVVTFNHPEMANPLSPDICAELQDVLGKLALNDAIRCLVLTGAGKHFSGGGNIRDFKGFVDSKSGIAPNGVHIFGKYVLSLRNFPKPTIAMVNGVAAGAGCCISLACDYRIAAPSSQFIMAFINMGLSGDTGSMYLLQKVVGTAKMIEMMHTGAPVGGEEALRIGLITKVTKEEELVEVTMKFAQKCAAGPLYAVKKQKALINKYFYSDFAAYLKDEQADMGDCSKTEDFGEAVNAFLEKRRPVFQGK